MSVTKQFICPIDLHSIIIIFFSTWKSMGSINCLVTYILQKYIYFWMNYPFNMNVMQQSYFAFQHLKQ